MAATTATRPPEADTATVVDNGPAWKEVARLTAPALAYLGARGVGLVLLAWMAARNHRTISSVLTSWDGHWFLGITANGYSSVATDLVDAHG
ncbi:MAG: hypothetical protein JO285_03685, partial [Kutzneria sp.]|nr:hypothetical protein [Kutzneria sp.]